MTLLEIRQQFIKLCGDESLATTVGLELYDTDNGADWFIHTACDSLDRRQDTPDSTMWTQESLAIGEYAIMIPGVRVIKSVVFENSSGEIDRLEKMLFDELMEEYPKLSGEDTGTPAHYALYPITSAPDHRGDLGENIGSRGLMIMPPTDEAITLKVYGLFKAQRLQVNASENFWSINYWKALVYASLREYASSLRNTEAVNDYERIVAEELLGIDNDQADQLGNDEMEMEG